MTVKMVASITTAMRTITTSTLIEWQLSQIFLRTEINISLPVSLVSIQSRLRNVLYGVLCNLLKFQIQLIIISSCGV